MKTETKHTPTPWEMNVSEESANSPHVSVNAIINGKYKQIGDLHHFTPDDRAVMIRAVNAHAFLLAQRDELRQALQGLVDAADDPENAKARDLVDAIDWPALRALLAKEDAR